MVALSADWRFFLCSFQCYRQVSFCFIPAGNFNQQTTMKLRAWSRKRFVTSSSAWDCMFPRFPTLSPRMQVSRPNPIQKVPHLRDWRIPSKLCLWAFSWNHNPVVHHRWSLIPWNAAGRRLPFAFDSDEFVLGAPCRGQECAKQAGRWSFCAGGCWVTFLTIWVQIADNCPRLKKSPKGCEAVAARLRVNYHMNWHMNSFKFLQVHVLATACKWLCG